MAINNSVTLIGNMGSDADIIDSSRLEITGSLSYRPYKIAMSDEHGEVKEITKYEASIIARKIELAPLVKKTK